MVEVTSCVYAQDISFPTEVFLKGSYISCVTIFAQIGKQMFDCKSKSLNTNPHFLKITHKLRKLIPYKYRKISSVVHTFHPKLFCSQSLSLPSSGTR